MVFVLLSCNGIVVDFVYMFPCFHVLIILYMNPWKSQVAQATLIHVCMENILHPKKCSLSDTLHALQLRRRPDLPRAPCLASSADRCSVSSVRACVSVRRVLRGLPCIWRGLCCAVRPGALGAGVSTGGVYSRRPAPPGQSPNHRKNKKDPPHLHKPKPIRLCKSPKIPKNTKRPLSRS